jgi:flagellin FlaA/flagellin FlaB
VLINTAGFLQSSAEQTGQESSDQVTNQIQVASKTGEVGGTTTTKTIEIDVGVDSGEKFAIDSGSSVEVQSVNDNGDSGFALKDSGNSELSVSNGDELRFTADGDNIEIANEATGATLTVAAGSGALALVNADGTASNAGDEIKLVRTFNDPENGEVTIESAVISDHSTESGMTISSGRQNVDAEIGENSERYIPLGNANSNGIGHIVSNGETATVGSGGGTVSVGSQTLSVAAEDSVEFTVSSSDEIEVTNLDSGGTLTFDPFSQTLSGTASLQFDDDDGGTVTIDLSTADPGVTGLDTDKTTGIGAEAFLVNDDYDSAGGVSEINLIAIKGSGADQINLEATTITTIGPEGTNTLTYGQSGAIEGESFGVSAVQDEDDSLPVMTDADRFRITIDPGTLGTGSTMTLEVTTESGATTEVRISVPNTLSGETAVQV